MASSEYLYSQLTAAGSRPTRFTFLVKLARRLIWPLVRPFHFFNLDKTNDLSNQINDLSNQINDLSNKIDQLYTQLIALENQTSRNLPIAATKYGLFIAKPGEYISDCIIKGGIWDNHVVKVAQKIGSSRRGTAIDIGAHLGSITLGLSSIFDRVLSFEPNDFNFRILRANVALNNLKNVYLYNNALYSQATHLSLGEVEKQELPFALNEGEFDGLASRNLGAYLFTENDLGIFSHPARTLDSYELNDVTFIKIDVQGADGEVLMGALQTIRQCQPTIVFEWEEKLSENFNITLDTVKNELHQLGYEINVLKKHDGKQTDYIARPTIFKR